MTIFIINSLHHIIVGDQIKDDEGGSGACILVGKLQTQKCGKRC